MQVRINEQQSMKLIVHLFDIGELTDEHRINPLIINNALKRRYDVKLVSVNEGKKQFEALQGLEPNISTVLFKIK